MGKIRQLIYIILIVFTLTVFVGCKKENFKVVFTYEDGTVIEERSFSKSQTVEIAYPKKEGHTFIGWFLNGEEIKMPYAFGENATVIAKYEANIYKYQFLVDGEVIKQGEVAYGTEIEYPENPVKNATDKESFVFAGWDNDAKVLKKDETFNAIFTSTLKEYTYIFEKEDGEVIKTITAQYGATIEYPENPTKESTEEYDFQFVGWDNSDEVLTKNVVFKPIFNGVKKEYTYKFLNYDGSLLKEAKGQYGTLPVEPETPTRPSDGAVKYVFVGWDKEIVEITGEVEYKATFKELANTLEGLKLSILGDSISTFYAEGSSMNSYYSEEGRYYYPIYSSSVKTVDKTWWAQLLSNTKMTLGINNSWSGSCAYGSGSSAGQSDDRINTIDENGTPNIVIIYLGTNDLVNGFSVQEYSSALRQMVTKIKDLGVEQVFITTMGYSAYRDYNYTEEARLAYNVEIRRLAEELKCGVVPIDEYIVEDNYNIYLGDRLHYNDKGAKLLSKIYEKAIKEFNGIEFNEDIEVEHQEKLPEGILGKITATANSDFWGKVADNIFFANSSFTNPQFSYRIQISKNEDNDTYYVVAIQKSGDQSAYNCDYVIVISESYKEYGTALQALSNVTVGSIVEFDESISFPLEITFKEGDGNVVIPEDPKQDEINPPVEGQLHISAYNEGVWTKYEETAIIFSQDKMDQKSTYINFYVIKLTKEENSNNYKITGLKTVDVNAEFSDCDYYILIYRTLADKSYYESAKLDDIVVIHGDPASGSCNIEFK